MNILQILPELNVGGVETGTVDFAHYLVQQGHKSVVVSNGGSLAERLEKEGSTHYSLPVHKKNLWTMFRMVGPLREIIRKEHIEIVHARSRVPAWIAFFACRKTQARFITTCHGYYKSRWFSQVMGWAKFVIVPSDVIARHMIDHFAVRPDSIRCIDRSINLKNFPLTQRHWEGKSQWTIGILGRITPLKGHSYFLQAMAKVIRRFPYVKIRVIGDAPQKKQAYRLELENLVQRLGIKDQVEFLGHQSDVPVALKEVDILCFSSIEPESFGRAIIEAQACGVPVVATRMGGVVDIIEHGKTGLLVMPKDTEAMAQEVMHLMENPHLGEQYTRAAQDKIKEKYLLKHMAEATLQVYEELLHSLNILVIKISSIGDVVLITASLKALRKKYPHAGIYCLVGKESRKILQNCPYLDGLIVYDHLHKDRGPFRFFRLVRKLRKYRFDKIIDFQNNRKSHFLSFFSFPRESYGFGKRKWSWLLTHPLKDYRNDIPAVAHQFQILKQMGIAYKDNIYLELWPSKKDEQYALNLLEAEWLKDHPKIVGINIAASAQWPTKNWPLEHIAKLCDLLGKNNIRVLITGMEKDRPAAEHVLSLTKSKPAILVGKTDVLQLASVIQRCQVYITPDSAPMHVAAAMKIPIICFFGPTDSARHIPPARKIIVLDRKLQCAPCYSRRCKILTHACMEEITPEEVHQQVLELMGAAV